MKLALILNVIDPKIGGVLIMGDRGTGKSTTIRAITDLLPSIEVVADDPFNSHPTDQELMSNEVRSEIENNSILKLVR
jgi:magnesium chelatase subunit I